MVAGNDRATAALKRKYTLASIFHGIHFDAGGSASIRRKRERNVFRMQNVTDVMNQSEGSLTRVVSVR